MEKGKYVTRSVYQKVVEENRKLLNDIKILTSEGINPESILLRIKWREKFKKDKDLNDLIKGYAIRYFKDHPEERIDA